VFVGEHLGEHRRGIGGLGEREDVGDGGVIEGLEALAVDGDGDPVELGRGGGHALTVRALKPHQKR
jgi:hypothetical protein